MLGRLLLGRLVSGIAALNLTDAVDLVVTSDHGMAGTATERSIYLDECVADMDARVARVSGGSPNINVWPAAGEHAAVLAELTGCHEALMVYAKPDVPHELKVRAIYKCATN